MAEEWTPLVPPSQPAPSSGPKPIPKNEWGPAVGPAQITPAVEQEARIQALAPFAQEELQKLKQQREQRREANPLAGRHPVSGQSLNLHDIPIVGPLVEKGIAKASASFAPGFMAGSDIGDTADERYRNALAYQEARRVAAQTDDPTAYTTTRIGAAIPTFLAPSVGIAKGIDFLGRKTLVPMAQQFPSIVEKAINLVTKPVSGAVEGGVLTGAHSMATSAPGSSSADIAESGKSGLEEGTAAGYLFGLPAHGIISGAKGAYNYFRPIFDPEGFAASEAAARYRAASPKERAAGLSPQEAETMSAEGKPVMPFDIAGGRKLGSEYAYNVEADDPFLSSINKDIIKRAENRSLNVQSDMYGATNRQINPKTNAPYSDLELRQQAEDAARASNKPAYDAAYSAPNAQAIWNPDLGRILNTAGGKQALEKTIESEKIRAAQERRPFVNPFYRDQNGNIQLNQNIGVPNLEFWDRFKRHMNDVVENQKDKFGKHTTESLETQNLLYGDKSAPVQAGGLTPFGQAAPQGEFALVPFLKSLVPEYDAALTGAQRFIKEDNAFDAGKNFLSVANVSRKTAKDSLFEADEKIKDFSRYSPQEKDFFRQGIVADINENPEQASAIFAKGDAKTLDRYRQVLGDDLFNSVDSTLRMHRIAGGVNLLQGLPPKGMTTAQKIALGTFSGGAGIVTALNVDQIYNLAMQNPAMTALSVVGAGTLGGVAVAKRAIDQAMIGKKTDAILKMLGSNEPETYKRIIEAAKNDAQFSMALKNVEYGIARAAALQSQNSKERPYVPPEAEKTFVEQNAGGRIGRDTGGRTNTPASAKAAQLIARVKHIRNSHGKDTESLLDLDDSTVAKALAIANQKI